MRPQILYLVLVTALLVGCDADPSNSGADDANLSLTTDAGVALTIELGDAGDPTHWTTLSASELWTHVAALDSTVTVGLKEPGAQRGVDRQGRAMLPRGLWTALSQQVAALGMELLSVDDFHPLVVLRLSGPGQIAALRRSPFVEFVEPASFDATGSMMDSISCGSSQPRQTGRTDTYGDLVPYTLDAHSVTQAWEVSSGAGITVGIVDTGVSAYQMQLGAQFASGQSSGRTIQYDYTDRYASTVIGEPSWHDGCGHGTKTLGLATAPRDGRGVVGVAYRANAFAIRALNGVVALGHFDEIREAIHRTAYAADIVSMSFGWSYGNSGVANAIRYYYNTESIRGRKTLFVGAAGTSSSNASGVVWPAEMPEVLAVTGTDDGVTACGTCHYGPELDFASYTAGQTTGTMVAPMGSVDAIGGSSGAAPLLAGIAALVRSRYPTMSRDFVINRLRAGAPHYWPSNQVGYGVVDAQLAVGPPPPPPPSGALAASITGASSVQVSVPTTWHSSVSGSNTPYSYYWDWAYQCSTGGGGSGAFTGMERPLASNSLFPSNLGETCDPTVRSGGTGSQTTITPLYRGTIRLRLNVSTPDGAEVQASKTVTVQ